MNPLDLLEGPLRSLLDFLHENVNLTYGWSIVVLTVIVRLCLLPLVIKQYASMRRMQAVAPQLKELQAEVQGEPRQAQRGADGVLQGGGDQPVLLLPAPRRAAPGLHRAVLRAEELRERRDRAGRVALVHVVVPDITEQLTTSAGARS